MTVRNMDFTLEDDEEMVRDLATSIFGRYGSDEWIRQTEGDGRPFDHELWQQLIDSGLVDVVLPSSVGGQDLGMVGLALVAEIQGRHLARIPLVPTATAAMALARFGAVDMPGDGAPALLGALRDGSARAAIALPDHACRVAAARDGDDWLLTGTSPQVYMAGSCTHLLVVTGEGTREHAFVVAIGTPGVVVDQFDGISRNIHATVTFSGVRLTDGQRIGGQESGAVVVPWIRQRFRTGLAAVQAGLCRDAVRRTAEYTSTREQFGRPLSTNQGVAMRAAEAHITTEAIRLTTLDAAWNLDQEGGDARSAVLAATWWACEGGFRVVHATQHLHGGMGADIDNHIHRYFLWAREIDIVAGPAPALLAELGECMGETTETTAVISSRETVNAV